MQWQKWVMQMNAQRTNSMIPYQFINLRIWFQYTVTVISAISFQNEWYFVPNIPWKSIVCILGTTKKTHLFHISISHTVTNMPAYFLGCRSVFLLYPFNQKKHSRFRTTQQNTMLLSSPHIAYLSWRKWSSWYLWFYDMIW